MPVKNLRPVIAIVQARMSSTRLPGKVMKEVLGRPVLWHVTNRLRSVKALDGIVVATSTDATDDAIERWCLETGIPCYRGSLEDVLKRYVDAARYYGAGTVVRITADCPLLDPALVQKAIESFAACGYDHFGVGGSFPDGCDAEVVSLEALERADREAGLKSEREHVTPYIWKNTQIFSTGCLKSDEDLSHMRWTVDDERDLEFVRRVYEGIGEAERAFGLEEVLEYLDKNPDVIGINSGTMRNEGYAKSLREDGEARKEAV